MHVSIRGFSDVIFTLVSYLPPCPTDLPGYQLTQLLPRCEAQLDLAHSRARARTVPKRERKASANGVILTMGTLKIET